MTAHVVQSCVYPALGTDGPLAVLQLCGTVFVCSHPVLVPKMSRILWLLRPSYIYHRFGLLFCLWLYKTVPALQVTWPILADRTLH